MSGLRKKVDSFVISVIILKVEKILNKYMSCSKINTQNEVLQRMMIF